MYSYKPKACHTWSVRSTAFLYGAVAMLAQVVLLRQLLAVVEENEIFLGVFFALWFAGIFVGATIGGRIRAQGNRLARITLALLTAQALFFPLCVFSIQAVRTNLGLPAAQPLDFSTLSAIAAAHLVPFSLITGLTFPLLCRLDAQHSPRENASLSTIYATEALGGLAAGAIFTFWLAGRIGAPALGLAAVGFVALNAALAASLLMQRGRKTWTIGFLIVAILTTIVWSPPVRRPLVERVANRAWRTYGGIERIAQTETRHGRLALARAADQFSLLVNGRFVLSFPDPRTAAATANLMLAERPSPRRILLIGGLGHGLVKHWLAAGCERIDVVEVDPDLPAFLMPWLPAEDRRALDDPRVTLHATDGRWFVKHRAASTPPQPYDMIVCLAPDPTTAAVNRFYSLEFFDEVRRNLAPGGVFAFDLGSAVNYFGPEVGGVVGSIVAALRKVFPDTIATPGTRTVFFASPTAGTLTGDPTALIARWEAMGLAGDGFSPLYFHTAFESGQTAFLARELERLAREHAPNTDLKPASYRFGLELWSRLSGSGIGAVLRLGDALRGWIIAVLLVLVGGAWWLWARVGRWDAGRLARRRALFVIATTGATGIALSLLLMLAFQTTLGYLYQQLGLLVALFMAGLAVGALAVGRSRRGRHSDDQAEETMPLRAEAAYSRSAWALAVCEAGQALFALIVAGALLAFLGRGVSPNPNVLAVGIASLMFIVGLFGGAEFTLAGRLYRSGRTEPAGRSLGLTAGWIDAADHLGAMAGAILTAIVLLPALGFIGTILTLAGLKCVGLWVCLVR